MNNKHSNEKINTEDKCDNCNDTNSNQYWDFEDGSVLCDKCNTKIGGEWNGKIYDNAEKDSYKEIKHVKVKSNFGSERKTNLRKYVIGGAILIFVLILGFSAKNILAGNLIGNSNNGQQYSTNVQSNNLAESGTVNGNNAGTGTSGTGIAAVGSGNVQNVKLALVDFSYKMTPNKIVKGVPVRIEVDASTLAGCMKNVVIKDFNVRKTITASDNIIEFTPDKTGVFWITCSMGMGPGSFEVVNSDGTSDPNAAAQVAAPKPSGGSCGASGGGCGCGG
jgi:hypothetical protein